MPIIRSSEKDLRRTARRTRANKATLSALRTAVKKARAQLDARDRAGAGEALASALTALDRAASKGHIHRNAAARTKSRLMRRLNRVTAAAKPERPGRP
jgi:small subunit ribosomal protein S20